MDVPLNKIIFYFNSDLFKQLSPRCCLVNIELYLKIDFT